MLDIQLNKSKVNKPGDGPLTRSNSIRSKSINGVYKV